jgi:hypothetical protein
MRIYKFNEFTITEGMISFSEISDTTYSNVRLNGIVKSDEINQDLMDDINTAAIAAKVRCYVTTGRSDHPSAEKPGSSSNHRKGMAVDVSRVGYDSTDWGKILSNRGPQSASESDPEYIDAGTKLAIELINLGYGLITSDESIKSQLKEKGMGSALKGSEGQKGVIWRTMTGGNHYNHLHISRQLDAGDTASSTKISSDEIKTGESEPTIGQRIASFFGFGKEDIEKKLDKVEPVKEGSCKIISGPTLPPKVPVIIAHPTEQISEKWLDFMKESFPELLNSFVVVYPNSLDVTWEQISKDVNSYVQGKKSEILNVSVMLVGSNCDSTNFSAYSKMDNVRMILLLNPPPTSSILKRIQSTKANVIIGMNKIESSKNYGDKEVTTFVDSFKKILDEKGLNSEFYFKDVQATSTLDLIKKVVLGVQKKLISLATPEQD